MSNSPSPGSSRWLMTSSSRSSIHWWWPSDSSIHDSARSGMRRSSSGAISSLAICQVSTTRPLFGVSTASTSASARIERVDAGVERHELVRDEHVVVFRGVLAQLAVALDDLLERALGAGQVADLDVVGAELGRRLPQQRTVGVRRRAALGPGIEEPVAEELELEPRQPMVVEQLAHLAQRVGVRLEDVAEVGKPDAHAGKADPLGVGAAVGEVEQAPLAAEVHLDRAGDRPIEPDQFGVVRVHARSQGSRTAGSFVYRR